MKGIKVELVSPRICKKLYSCSFLDSQKLGRKVCKLFVGDLMLSQMCGRCFNLQIALPYYPHNCMGTCAFFFCEYYMLIVLDRLEQKMLIHQHFDVSDVPSLKLTYPLKIGLPNRKVVFQPSIFKGYVSFREGNHYTKKTGYPSISSGACAVSPDVCCLRCT